MFFAELKDSLEIILTCTEIMNVISCDFMKMLGEMLGGVGAQFSCGYECKQILRSYVEKILCVVVPCTRM